jgi:hypothetical protein
VGDTISFGDLGFNVTGAADTKVKFKYEGPLFEAGLEGGASLWANAGQAIKEERNFNNIVTEIEADEPFLKEYEIDLYFDLTGEVQPGLYEGDIIAIAMYE